MENTIHEELKQENTYIELLRIAIRVMKFGTYVCISFLELLLRVIKVLLNLTEYRPLQPLTEAKNNMLNNIASKKIQEYEQKYSIAFLTRHTYEFERSELYSNTYKYIQEHLKDFANNNVTINQDIYKDILTRIDILTVEADKKALQEGYHYAKLTKYKLSNEEVYEDYLKYQIMRGEGNGKTNQKYRTNTD